MGILGCEYTYISENSDLIAVFRNCVVQYAKNTTCTSGTKVSWVGAQCELLVHATPGSFTTLIRVRHTRYTEI